MRLSKEIRQQFEREKNAYWAMRNDLIKKYKGKWVAVANEQVVAVGDKRGKVMEEAYNKTKRKVMFVSEVGFEDRVLRIRQISTGELDYNYYPAAPIIKTPISDIVQTLNINMISF
ncbi:MAG: hypothetical protein JSW07_00175 [bacterium]|nr:MAG: hypothetical protein JSW07_00175 [bacterium]